MRRVAIVIGCLVLLPLAAFGAWELAIRADAAAEPFGTCTVYTRGRGARVHLVGRGAEEGCRSAVAEWSDQFVLWTSVGDDLVYRSPVCELRFEGLRVSVSDTGSGDIGQGVCASFLRAGGSEVVG